MLHLTKLNDTHTHTHILGGTPLDEGYARLRNLYLSTHNIHAQTESHALIGIRIRFRKHF